METPRYVLITGASKGIGAACALQLDQLGFHVFAGVRRAVDGEALQKQASSRLQPILLDVTDQVNIAAAAATIRETVGDIGLYGLVNNAGVAVIGPLEVVPLAEVEQQFHVNVYGPLAVTQTMLDPLRQAQGRIVNISSISGRIAFPFSGAYAASKFALEALSDAFRRELAPWQVQVALIEPGVIDTPIWDASIARGERLFAEMTPRHRELYGASMEAQHAYAVRAKTRGIPPEEVAKAVAHALTARRARTRYLVGADARMGALIARLPARVVDMLIERLRRRMLAKLQQSTQAGETGPLTSNV